MELHELTFDEIEKFSRETHFSLRLKLIELKHADQMEKSQAEMLRAEIAKKMRELDEYHSELYYKSNPNLRPAKNAQDYFNRAFPYEMEEYFQWRNRKLAGDENTTPGDDAYWLRKNDMDKYKKVFSEDLYGYGEQGNHWTISTTHHLRPSQWTYYGDIHTNLRFSHIMAYYKKGSNVRIYRGSESYLRINGSELHNTPAPYMVTGEPTSTWPNSGKGHVQVSSEGEIQLNLPKK